MEKYQQPPQETANTLNDYFASVFKVENHDNIPNFEDRGFTQVVETVTISEELVAKAIDRLNNRIAKSQV